MCEFKYYLNYHLSVLHKSSFAAEQGSMVHVIYEKFGEAKRDGIQNAPIETKWYDAVLHAYREQELWKMSEKAIIRDKDCESCSFFQKPNSSCFVNDLKIDEFDGCPKDEFDDAIWLVEKVINDKSVNNPLTKKVIDVEQRFDLVVKDGDIEIPIVGLMDIVTELDNETIEIVDYKSGKYAMSYNECLKDPQLLIYNFAANKIYKNYKNIFITIYYLRKRPITLSFEPKAVSGTESAIKKYWNLIGGNKSPKRRCDMPDGSVRFDHICKYMCDIETCKTHYKDFKENNHLLLPERESSARRTDWLSDFLK